MSTKDDLLQEAVTQFAAKGFYGTSIANIAAAFQVSKQALLHHFGTKEKLYGEILAGVSSRIRERCEILQAQYFDPAELLEAIIVDNLLFGQENPEQARLLMRELLDNEPRADQADSWYLKSYLELLIQLVKQIDNLTKVSDMEALTIIYQFLGATNYVLISQPTLQKMFGRKEFNQLMKNYEKELRILIRARLNTSH